jgi:NADH-quinone oxidoreductase subunit A
MSPYASVAILCALTAIVIGTMVSLNALLGPRATTPSKSDPFECGNPPSGSAFGRFSVRFYLTAILFILFDVEVVFLYPWAVLFRDLGMFGFVEMLTFLLVLGIGLLYAWRKGALEWD